MKRIPLRARDGSVRANALVDDADFDWLNQWRWYQNSTGYAVRKAPREDKQQKAIRMHRLILGLGRGDAREGDHINRNVLDNQRANLRIADHRTNGQNRGLYATNSSGYRGVVWHRGTGKWQAQAMIDHRLHYLGLFDSAQDADAAVKAFRAERMPFSDDAREPVDA